MAEQENVNAILIDNMDDSDLCNSEFINYDFSYKPDWNYTGSNYNYPEESEYDGKIYYDEYHHRYVLGKNSVLELDYTDFIKSFINSTNFPVTQDDDGSIDIIPYIGSIYLSLDTLDGDESNLSVTISIAQGNKSADFDLTPGSMVDVNISTENNEIITIDDSIKYYITVFNTSDQKMFLKNIALGFVVNEMAQNT
jgi:hypothetical protein